MNKFKIGYYLSTVLLSALFLFSAIMYFTQYDAVQGVFQNLGFPTWIIYPLGFVKILGVLAIWLPVPRMLKEWAYAGFFFDAALAFGAHHYANDGEEIGAIIAIILTLTSRYFMDKRDYPN